MRHNIYIHEIELDVFYRPFFKLSCSGKSLLLDKYSGSCLKYKDPCIIIAYEKYSNIYYLSLFSMSITIKKTITKNVERMWIIGQVLIRSKKL